jgi:hypothetical protein
MQATIIKIVAMTALCLAPHDSSAQSKDNNSTETAKPTGTTGATAFQPGGSQKAEAEAGTAQDGTSLAKEHAKPGFNNKPAKGAKASCHQPQGGVDASGGENVKSASKDNTSCTGKKAKG